MGTRWLCHVRESGPESKIITTIYGQWDGYPSGAGNDIKKILGGRKLVNGIQGSPRECVNGMGCAAAVLVSALKGEDAGSIYIYAPGTNDVWEEYVYDLYDAGGELGLKLGTAFEGRLSDFDGEAIEKADDES